MKPHAFANQAFFSWQLTNSSSFALPLKIDYNVYTCIHELFYREIIVTDFFKFFFKLVEIYYALKWSKNPAVFYKTDRCFQSSFNYVVS